MASIKPEHESYMNVRRNLLFMLLKQRSFKQGKFTLSSGRESDFYINCKKSLTAEGLRLIAEQFAWAAFKHAPDAQAIGGLTMGADPIAYATSLWVQCYYASSDMILHPFSIRKEPKKHGTMDFFEGPDIRSGTQAIIVEDVITTGASAIKAIQRATEYGLKPVFVFALVDREEDRGRETIVETQKVPVLSIFTRKDFIPETGT